jgi:hypothetical protein
MSLSNNDNEKVPLFKTWKGWYRMVILALLIVIVLFYFFTKRFA